MPDQPSAASVGPKQVILIRKDLNMPRGKVGAQSAHASWGALESEPGCDIVQVSKGQRVLTIPLDEESYIWFCGDTKKIVLAVHSEAELVELYEKAKAAGLRCRLVRDNGLTMFKGVQTLTAASIGPHNPERIDCITGHLKPL